MTEDLKPPTFLGEFRQVFSLCAKILGFIALVIGVFASISVYVARYYPDLASYLFYGFMLVAIVLFFAWQQYQWKKKDYRRMKEISERHKQSDLEWKAAQKKVLG